MWKKELEIIENLGKLYPVIDQLSVHYKYWGKLNFLKAQWVYLLCRCHLNQRLPRLENFIKKFNVSGWNDYKKYFKITDRQCGKKS